jgi:hypothetical protein
MTTTLKHTVSELLTPSQPQAALDLRCQQPEAKRARTAMDIIDLCHSQSIELESPLPSPTVKSTTVEAPKTPERKAVSEPECPPAPRKRKEHEFIDWDKLSKTLSPEEFKQRLSEAHPVENDAVITAVPIIPFTQVDEAVEDDEDDEDMTQHFEETQVEQTQVVEQTQPETQVVETQAEETVEPTQLLQTQSQASQVGETVPYDDPEPRYHLS